jgi:hypothetical protein
MEETVDLPVAIEPVRPRRSMALCVAPAGRCDEVRLRKLVN